jgi:DNA-binding beta-propeller fold protein YncE
MKKSIIILVVFASVASVLGLKSLVYPPFKHTWGVTKGTEAKLDMLLGNATDFDNPQGIAVTRLLAWDDPKSTKDDDELTAYGVNAGRNQIIYNTSMYSLGLYGSTGSGKDQFRSPRGISADPKGEVFVCDTGNKRLVKLFNNGKTLKWAGVIGEGILEEPHDVSVTEAETVFVTDRARGTIEVFTYSGEHVRTLQGFVNPRGIAVDHPNMTKTRYGYSRIYVADADGEILRCLDYEGKVIATANLRDIPVANASVKYLALDFYHNLWATDSVVCKIHKFDVDLKYITSIGECGTKDYQFTNPVGIAIWRRFGQVVVGESNCAQYFWIGTDVEKFETSKGTDRDGNPTIDIDIFFTDGAYAKIEVLSGKDVVRQIYEQKRLRQGDVRVSWDLKNNAGNRVPPGKYTIRMTYEPTYSSYGFFNDQISTEVIVE